jgi:hypothetical protein
MSCLYRGATMYAGGGTLARYITASKLAPGDSRLRSAASDAVNGGSAVFSAQDRPDAFP